MGLRSGVGFSEACRRLSPLTHLRGAYTLGAQVCSSHGGICEMADGPGGCRHGLWCPSPRPRWKKARSNEQMVLRSKTERNAPWT